MKKILLILFALSFFSAAAQMPDTSRARLIRLLNDRKMLFETYLQSLDRKSGLFGGRTKRDLKFSHEFLSDIVEVDNNIMENLNRALDYKSFEKQTMSYDINEIENRIANLQIVNDTLTNQAEFYRKEAKGVRKELKTYKVYFVLLILLSAALAFLLIRENHKAR